MPEDWAWTGQRYADALVKPGDVIYVHLSSAMEGKARRATLEQDCNPSLSSDSWALTFFCACKRPPCRKYGSLFKTNSEP